MKYCICKRLQADATIGRLFALVSNYRFISVLVRRFRVHCNASGRRLSLLKLTEDPHRRLNPLTSEWVLVSPHRAGRPWQGQLEKVPAHHEPEYDPTCYLCPGNPRVGGVLNPRYTGTFVFDNDFAALKPAVRDDRLDLENRDCWSPKASPDFAG